MLEIIIDLTWKQHIRRIRQKANGTLVKFWWLLKGTSQFNLKSRTLLYKAMIKPLWNCIVDCGSYPT